MIILSQKQFAFESTKYISLKNGKNNTVTIETELSKNMSTNIGCVLIIGSMGTAVSQDPILSTCDWSESYFHLVLSIKDIETTEKYRNSGLQELRNSAVPAKMNSQKGDFKLTTSTMASWKIESIRLIIS